MNKSLKKVAGGFLVGLGIIGLFLPFLQGILLIAAGLATIGNKRAIKLFEKLKQYSDRKKRNCL
ncbi:MAG: PGPGW domain-containing protein [Candidatus Cloacimonadota bacterium]|nr:PGPGW domain-containing protein [Candidatus Cloacimonadota bacterium]